MAVKTKTQLHTAIASLPNPITPLSLTTILDDVVDSYEDVIRDYTTTQRDALTPTESQIIYNTTANRLEYYSTDQWLPVSDTENIAIDCSANPNYPSGLLGEQYVVTVAGKIGGGSGADVFVGDIITCIVANAGGTEGSVGSDWKICHAASSTDSPTFYAETNITTGQILALNGTPIELIAAPGVGKVVLVQQVICSMTFNSIAYATNTSMRLLIDDNNGLTIFDLSQANDYVQVTPFSFAHDLYANQAVKATVNSGNPTAGNSAVKVGVYYKLHTL